MARGNDRPGLWLVDEGGGETKLSFAELAERSDRIANWLRALGVRRGDRLLLMLANLAPLWECMLAAMKLGAVIVPATTLLNRDDLLDRFARGRVRHFVTGADNAGKFADLPGDYTRIAVGGGSTGWRSRDALMTRWCGSRLTVIPRRATCRCSIHLGTTASPSWSMTIRAIGRASGDDALARCSWATSISTLRPGLGSTPTLFFAPGTPGRQCSC
jgi:hypothetical protein